MPTTGRTHAPIESGATPRGPMAALNSLLGSGLGRNAVLTMVLRGTYCVLELLCGLAVARTFHASGYGIYALAVSWVMLLAIPAAAGFDRVVLREIGIHSARSEWPLVRGILNRSRHVVLVTSITLALAVAGAMPLLAHGASKGTVTALQLAMVVVPLLAFARLRQASLQGLGHVAAGQVPEMLVQPLTLLALVAVLYLMPGLERSGPVAVAMYALSMGVACVVGLLILRQLLPAPVLHATPDYRTRSWMRIAGPFFWMLAMNVVMTNADTILVGIFAGSTDAGTYRLVSQAAMLVAFPLTCINMAVAPNIAALFARGDMRALQVLATRAARVILVTAVPIAIGLIALGPLFLRMFGSEFSRGFPSLAILTVAYVINAAAGTAGYLLIMTRYENHAAIVFGVAAAVNVAGNLVLIPLLGIYGAALATVASIVVVSVAFILMVWRMLGIQPTALRAPARAHTEGA